VCVPSGSTFATASVNGQPSVMYATAPEAVLPDSGSIAIPAVCTQPGTDGNAAAETVVRVACKLTQITGVSNPQPMRGGTAEEDNESLMERILEYDRSQGESFTGCLADYHRWAKEVPGVGAVTVLPTEDTSGTVTILVTDANGEPATQELLTAVYQHIMRPDAEMERLAPLNAKLDVRAPELVQVCVSAAITLSP